MSMERELAKNKPAELLAYQVMKTIYEDKVDLRYVADVPKFYHRGDIVGRRHEDGEITFFDVKNDGEISRTGNIFAETHKYFNNNRKERHSGFMENGEYDYLLIVNQKDKQIYVVDFEVLKEIHKLYREVPSYHDDALCYGRIVPLERAKARGALLYTIDYDGVKGGYYYTKVTPEQENCELRLLS